MDAQNRPYDLQLGRQGSDLSDSLFPCPSPSDHRPGLPANDSEVSSPDNCHSEAELDLSQKDKLHAAVAWSVKTSRASFTGCVHVATEDDRSSMASESCVKSEPYPKTSPLGSGYKLAKAAESNISGSQDSPCGINGCDTCVISSQPRRFDEHNEVLMWRRPPVERSEELTSAEAPLSTTCRNSLRSCKLCGTTKTPLWRSGPLGPKSLCNACGIRYKKARRPQAANGYPDLQISPPRTPTPGKFSSRPLKRKVPVDQEEIVNGRSRQRLKKGKWPALMVVRRNLIRKVEDTESCLTSPGTPSPRKRSPQNMPYASSRRKEAAAKLALLQQQGRLTSVFAMDEEEAAVLLMALSCGLVLA